MDENTLEKISTTFQDVMEKQVFMFPEPAAREGFVAGEHAYLLTWMNFYGKFPGNVLIAVPEGLAREIGANFLGMDVDDPFIAETYPDSLKEILNVTCGHILTALKGDNSVYDLSIPNVAALTLDDLTALARDPDCLAFDVEGFSALLRVDFEPVSPQDAKKFPSVGGRGRGGKS